MVQCETCKDWFHPSCMSFTPDQVKRMEKFVCPDCSLPDGDRKLRQSSPGSSPTPEHVHKPEAKRRKRWYTTLLIWTLWCMYCCTILFKRVDCEDTTRRLFRSGPVEKVMHNTKDVRYQELNMERSWYSKQRISVRLLMNSCWQCWRVEYLWCSFSIVR